MDNTKAQLQKLIDQIKTKQFRDGEAQGLTKSVGGEITKQLKPAFEALGKDLTNNISSAIKELKINVPEGKQAQVNVNVPDVIVPEIRVPEPKVTVNVPPFPKIPDFPKLEMPETMKVVGSVEIANNDYKNPLKVQLVDLMNRPYESVGGGGFAGGVKINNSSSEAIPVTGTFVSSAPDSTAAVLINREGTVYNTDNPLPVVVTSGASATSASNIVDSSGVAYSGSNPIPVTITSGATATSASNIVDSSGVAYSGSNPFPVTITSGATATTAVQNLNADGTYRDTFPVQGTVAVSGITGSIGATILNGEGLARDSWLVSGITNSVKTALVDSTGVQYSGSNPLPISDAGGSITVDGTFWQATQPVSGTVTANLSATDNAVLDTIDAVLDTINAKLVTGTDIGDVTINNASGASAVNIQDGGNSITIDGTVAVSGITNSVATASIDSSGIQYSGSNPMPVKLVAGIVSSTIVEGANLHDAVDIGSAPIKVGGVAVQANPTAVSGGDTVRFTADDLGRQITRPIQVRDLIATAYVSKATGSTFGTETTLLAATAGSMFDLIYIMGTNDSTVGIQCDIRGITAGNVLMSLYIPPAGTAGVALPVPFPQTTADTGNAWTIDLPDVTGTNVNVSALFSKEV